MEERLSAHGIQSVAGDLLDIYGPPLPEADVYSLVRVLHDWDDDHAVRHATIPPVPHCLCCRRRKCAHLLATDDALPLFHHSDRDLLSPLLRPICLRRLQVQVLRAIAARVPNPTGALLAVVERADEDSSRHGLLSLHMAITHGEKQHTA